MNKEEKNSEENPKEQIANSNEETGNENNLQEQTIEQAETTNSTSEISKSEIQNMEVHHHPHVEKKNFKEYFLEFLMIFLAVTLGFFAESFREHLSDSVKEKEYIVSMIEDAKTDTLNISNAIASNRLRAL